MERLGYLVGQCECGVVVVQRRHGGDGVIGRISESVLGDTRSAVGVKVRVEVEGAWLQAIDAAVSRCGTADSLQIAVILEGKNELTLPILRSHA